MEEELGPNPGGYQGGVPMKHIILSVYWHDYGNASELLPDSSEFRKLYPRRRWWVNDERTGWGRDWVVAPDVHARFR